MKYTFLVLSFFIWSCNSPRTFYFQAYDDIWDDPAISPVFEDEEEALDYADRNNMGSGHEYKVRVVDYRYEIRHINDVVDNAIYHTLSLRDAKSYLNEYGMSHNDLFLYDLKTGNLIETSTP